MWTLVNSETNIDQNSMTVEESENFFYEVDHDKYFVLSTSSIDYQNFILENN